MSPPKVIVFCCDVAQYISGYLLAVAEKSPENLLTSQVIEAVRLLTFGGLSVHKGAGPLAGAAAQPRRLAVLALIARAGERGATRGKVLALLWPDADDAQGRRVLSQALYALRRELGNDACIVGTQDLRLNAGHVWCDVAEFESAINNGDLETAARLYVGPFLEGFRLASAPEFERWADEERSEIQHRFHEAVEQLARAAEIDGAFDVAVKWWRRRAADDPLNARVAVSTMRALAAAGDRAGALREARIFEALIAQELEMAPDRAVVELADELRRAPAAAAIEMCLALTPFTMLGTADERTQHDWSEGLSEEIVTALANVSGAKVAGRSSTTPKAVTHTIEGSLRFSADQVRVAVRVVDASSGHTVWAERFEKAARDSHASQERIADEIARAVGSMVVA
jgi:DNA-binding SARP family transcriptional activator